MKRLAAWVVGDSLSIIEGIMTMKVAVDSSNTNEIRGLDAVLSESNNRV